MRRIRISYDVVTPESAADGDYAEVGWKDEDGVPIVPDECDLEVYDDTLSAVVGLACDVITGDGLVEPSSSQWHRNTWYTQIDPDRDYGTGAETRHSFHLVDFSEREERAIFAALTGK